MPESAGGREPRRGPPYGGHALVAAAVLGVLVLAVWSRAPDAPRRLEPQPDPVSAWEAVLRSHLPPGIAATCASDDSPPRMGQDALVSLVCTPGLPVLRVQFSVLPDVASLRARHAEEVRAHVGTSPEPRPGPGTCGRIGGVGAGPWWMASLQTRIEDAGRHPGPPPAATVASVGRVACWWDAETATLAWYDEDTLVYAWATTTPGLAADLYRWWRRGAPGPWHPPVGDGPYREVSATEEAP